MVDEGTLVDPLVEREESSYLGWVAQNAQTCTPTSHTAKVMQVGKV